MKNSNLAIAVLLMSGGAASAATGVTIYGNINGGARYTSNANAAGGSLVAFSDSGTYHSNRLGFKGREDLGDGMNAHFLLEERFNSGSGAQVGVLFNGNSYVGLGGSWGTVDLGRQYSINFKTIGAYDPFHYKYTGIVPLAGQGGITRFNNDIQYTGKSAGFTGRVEYAFGEVAGSTGDGGAQAVGGTYKAGPIVAGASYTRARPNVGTSALPSYQEHHDWTVGGAYSLGNARLALGYANDSQDKGAGVSDTTTKDTWIGGNYRMSSAVDLSAAFYRTRLSKAAVDGYRNLVIVGATYAFSKRTMLYADVDHGKYGGSSIPSTGKDTQTGVSLGMEHVF